jgi:hypothetical protein
MPVVIVRMFSSVMRRLAGESLRHCRPGNRSGSVSRTERIFPRSMAMPMSVEETLFVQEHTSCSVSAAHGKKYASITR